MLGSRTGSSDSIDKPASVSTSSSKVQGARVASAIATIIGIEEQEEDLYNDTTFSTKATNSLRALIQRHKDELSMIENQCKQEINDCQLSFEAKLQEMEEQQEKEIQMLVEDQERQLVELKHVQDKEIQMEESMHDSEMKMLVERRILNSVLETVADGIINITPIGVVVRFNHAAELMFGYTPQEVIGNNITMLMPERFSRDHATYLTNYLTTGIKKVIGIGRRVAGLRKNGEEFPLHLSISEMKDEGEHLFTGIARDLTKEVEEETRNRERDGLKQKELEGLAKKLDMAKEKANNLLSQMLPPSVSKQLMDGKHVEPQQFESATVCFLDVVGFSSITSQIQPLDTVTFLNELYKTIDRVIEKYDVYKVETVGDTYLVVGGVPKANKTHASEIATMSLHVLHAIEQFQFSGKPDIKVRMRIGLNSGPLVAGVIGTKMPRYCLFGDTVNTSSRMESNGEAGKIHISESTFQLLKKDANFELMKRGEIEVKGKGKMTTYWVQSKNGFEPDLLAV
jgi:PAS domain S-box-containing protein